MQKYNPKLQQKLENMVHAGGTARMETLSQAEIFEQCGELIRQELEVKKTPEIELNYRMHQKKRQQTGLVQSRLAFSVRAAVQASIKSETSQLSPDISLKKSRALGKTEVRSF